MCSPWTNVRVLRGVSERVAKYVFEKEDAVAEAVLYKYPRYEDRTVICCSTQSGCPIGCRFCGAGDSFVRSLTADEIVSQPTRLLTDTGVTPAAMQRLQIMFMSMGEPLLNFEATAAAIRGLHDRYPHAELLVSTSAPAVDYERVRRISVEVPTVGLQFSVHETTDERRDALIPFKRKLTLAQIAKQGQLWAQATGRRPFFNYCVHAGNVTASDARRLVGLFDPRIWEATISVVCERDELVAAANDRQRSLARDFSIGLAQRGFSVRVFDPAGQDDVGGGCGQLWFVQSWMHEHPTLARSSVGQRLPIVHTPR